VGKTRACSLLQAAAHRCKDVEVPNLVAVAVSTVAIAMPTAAIAMSAVDDEASLCCRRQSRLPPQLGTSTAPSFPIIVHFGQTETGIPTPLDRMSCSGASW
jgi:hypothetical protein